MDRKFLFLQDVMVKISDFDRMVPAGKPLELADFAAYVLDGPNIGETEKRKLSGPINKKLQKQGERQDTGLAILVTFLYRYAKLYAKRVLVGTEISGLDDFSYLIIMMTHESMSKSELIQKNVHEKATGMEIIRRLVTKKLFRQFSDKEDKRSKRVAITLKGKKAVMEVLPDLEPVSMIITGTLNQEEKDLLQDLLRRLDHFHFDIFVNHRAKPIKDIIKERIV